ncbi:MAG: FAD-dependent oxidoreductase [Erysipelotrichaceae bacterium]|nr:FAD-dependent oxidoreductase [Erysipelotrichaceae bacterium]
MGEEKPNEKILALGKKITDVAKHKIFGITSDDPEYWGLRTICTDEMADIALKMKVRAHYTLEEMVKLTGIGKEKLEPLLEEMAHRGLLEFDYGDHYTDEGPVRDAPKIKRYQLPMFVPGSAEFTNMLKEQIDEFPELAQFFERMTFLPLAGITEMVPPGGAGIGMHVIPVEKAISMENKTLDIEHISHWLKKYEGHLGVGICSCRYGRAKLGEGCGDSYEDWCIGVGDMADYCRETGKGHDITYEEAMEILKNAEDNGFVHQITNIDGEDKIFAICNCNVNICNALRTSQLFNTPNLSRSAYTAKVDPKNCVACGKCVEYCPAGAVRLGQKLCTKNGPMTYPKHELPDHLSWGEDKWDEDYRDNNRINCYDSGTAPCKTACPAHIAIQGYLKMAAQGRYRDALALIKKDNPFPAICGRVCNKRCEDACTRGMIDEAVSIDAVKKFIAQQDLNAENRYVPPVVIPSNVEKHWKQKIAIIGSGPAGLSCAYYLAVKGYLPVVFEKNAYPGGMMRYGIPSYKLEKDVIDAEIDILRELGVEIRCNTEVGKDITLDDLRKQGFEAFYIAIGCQGGKLPGIPNESGKNRYLAVNFLKEAYEDPSKELSGKVIVIGGGNVAIDCARTAHRLKGRDIEIYCLESRDTMPATKQEIAEAEEEFITINNGWGPKEVRLNSDGSIKDIVFKKCLSTVDENGKFSPVYDEDDITIVPADHIIYAIGQAIEWKQLLKGSKVEFWHGDYPVADQLTYQTAQEDIFVGGDVYTGPKFVIDAIEQGHQAADSLHRFVQPGTSMTIGKNRRQFVMLDKDNIEIDDYDHAGRQYEGMDESIDYKNSFRDAHRTLSEEQVRIETARCLSCGASVVDENKCIGCGICTTKCEFDAIHLFRDHPEHSTMIRSEDKFKAIIPYAAKRAVNIKFGKKSEEEKLSEKKHKEWKKAKKEAAKNA